MTTTGEGRNAPARGPGDDLRPGEGNEGAGGIPPSLASERAFLAPDLGAGVDDEGEPVLVNLNDVSLQPALKQVVLRLMQDFQSRRAAIEDRIRDADLTPEDLWTPGITETVTTSSSEDEIARYRLKLRYRADFLQAALEETLLELEGLRQGRLAAAPDTPVEATTDRATVSQTANPGS